MRNRGSRSNWQLVVVGLVAALAGCRASPPNQVRAARAEVLRSRADAEVEAMLRDIAAREAALLSNRRQARELQQDLDAASGLRKERAAALSQALSLVEALEQDLAAANARAEQIRQELAGIEAQASELAGRDARIAELRAAIDGRAAQIATLEAELAAGAEAFTAKQAELSQRKAVLLERVQKLDAALSADQPPAPETPPAAEAGEASAEGKAPPAGGGGGPDP